MATKESGDHLHAAIWFIATQTDGPARVLAEHRTTPNGMCVARHHPDEKWPCTAARIALRALTRPGKIDMTKDES